MNLLCERAAGFFVHAIATVRFIDQKTKNPETQLYRLLQSLKSGIEGRTEFRAKTTLDSLYTSILQETFDDPEDDSNVRFVLSAVVLAINPLSPSTIAALLGFKPRDVFPLLSSAHSLLVLQEDINHPVRPFHKSFPDFITDSTRSTNPRFHVCPSDQHAKPLVGCLELMNLRLEQNICKHPDGVTNSEVDGLKERTKQYIDDALEYAYRSWHKHLIDKIPAQTSKTLYKFLTEKFLFWLEVLSVIGAVRDATDALETTAKWPDIRSISLLIHSKNLLDWVQGSLTLNLAKDYSRFVHTLFDLISTSAPHVYHSALPLSPKTSMVREMYTKYKRPSVRVVHGLPTSWEPAIATVYDKAGLYAVAWSPCNKIIAVAKPGAVEIRDAVTLSPVGAFKSPCSKPLHLSFSPDSRSLIQLDGNNLITWDVQTGGSVSKISPEDMRKGIFDLSAYSMDGTIFSVVYEKMGTLDSDITAHDISTTHASYRHRHRISETSYARVGPTVNFSDLPP